MLGARDPRASICPSEPARQRFGNGYRDHMEDVRRAARRLAYAGFVTITQRDRVVNPATIRGPIRIARGASFDGWRDDGERGERAE